MERKREREREREGGKEGGREGGRYGEAACVGTKCVQIRRTVKWVTTN